MREEVQVVVTTADYRRGQAAAWVDFARDRDATPNREVLMLVSAEFRAGYCDEWENFCVPARVRAEREEADRVAGR